MGRRDSTLEELGAIHAQRILEKQARKHSKRVAHTKKDRKLVRKALVQGLMGFED